MWKCFLPVSEALQPRIGSGAGGLYFPFPKPSRHTAVPLQHLFIRFIKSFY